jgi:hypothetical protein
MDVLDSALHRTLDFLTAGCEFEPQLVYKPFIQTSSDTYEEVSLLGEYELISP